MTKDMTRGTPWKLIVQFALPIMAGNLLQQLYNTADTIIVGNFNGQQALSAVGSCASLTALFTALAIGFSIGAGVLISQYFGANRLEELRRYAASSIVLMLLLGLLMSVIGFCSAELLLARFLGTPQALLPQAALYFTIYAAGLVFSSAITLPPPSCARWETARRHSIFCSSRRCSMWRSTFCS